MDKIILEQSFHFALTMSQNWWHHGSRLLRSAYVLLEHSWKATERWEKISDTINEILPGTKEFEILEDSFLYEQATFLLALSLENMLKALWVEQHHRQIGNSKSVPKQLRMHDIAQLADKTGIQITLLEREALNILTKHSIWIGKYPMPIFRDDYVDQHGKVNRVWILQKYPGPVKLPDEVESLIPKIWKEVEILLRNRWNK